MPEIGETLREARMRQRIDISEVEAATKIRAKYLRALENEEWALLPGTTFVKTFLRTYGEYLGLDARLLVEEYRQRFEQPSTMDLTPFTPAQQRARRPRRPRPVLSPGILLGLGAVVLLAVLYVLGTAWNDDDGGGEESAGPNRVTDQRSAREPGKRRKRDRGEKRGAAGANSPKRVRLKIVPTATVWVCLENADGKRLVSSQTLQAGQERGTFTSRKFRLTLGNGQARLVVNGKSRSVPPSSNPVGYEVTRSRRLKTLPEDERPDCT